MAINAIPTPIYQPARRVIQSITNANPALVTCTFATEYRTGDIIRMVIPLIPFQPVGFGMPEVNGNTYTVTVNDSTSFYINEDSTNFEPFGNYNSYAQQAQIVPVGEVNSTILGATQNTLPTLVRPFSP